MSWRKIEPPFKPTYKFVALALDVRAWTCIIPGPFGRIFDDRSTQQQQPSIDARTQTPHRAHIYYYTRIGMHRVLETYAYAAVYQCCLMPSDVCCWWCWYAYTAKIFGGRGWKIANGVLVSGGPRKAVYIGTVKHRSPSRKSKRRHDPVSPWLTVSGLFLLYVEQSCLVEFLGALGSSRASVSKVACWQSKGFRSFVCWSANELTLNGFSVADRRQSNLCLTN